MRFRLVPNLMTLNCVQVYSPTTAANEEVTDRFYEDLDSEVRRA